MRGEEVEGGESERPELVGHSSNSPWGLPGHLSGGARVTPRVDPNVAVPQGKVPCWA